jgi:Zn-dependent protease with chaperone function
MLKREFLDYAVSVLVPPAIGLVAALIIERRIQSASQPRTRADLWADCLAERGGELCALLDSTSTLLIASQVLLLLAPVLLLACFAVLKHVRASRSLLALQFPFLLKTYLMVVAGLLAAQACLVMFSAYELAVSGRLSLYLLVFVGVLGVAWFASAVSIVSDLPRALNAEPLQVTGVMLVEEQLQPLAARVTRLAERLAMRPPAHIVIGLEPRVFATSAEIMLCGEGELSGTTLHIPLVALRVLSEDELDALILRELAALRGEAEEFTRHFVPMCASVANLSDLELDSERMGAIAKLARLPANAFLMALLRALQSAQHHVRLQREQDADRAALDLTGGRVVISALTKACVLELRWKAFRNAYQRYMLRGQKRRNLVVDYLTHLERHIATSDPAVLRANLLVACLSDVFAVSTPLGRRGELLGVSMDDLVTEALQQLSQTPPREEHLMLLEEQLTLIENEYSHVPGRRLVLNTQEPLPVELAAL